MKKTKLLPILGISATCAAIAPITLTGCSSNKSIDLMEVYTPNIEAAKPFTKTQSITDLTEWYFEEAAKNTNIYVQDFYYSHSLYTNFLIQNKIIKMISSNAMISNVSFTSIKSTAGDVTPAINCDIAYTYSGYPDTNSGIPEEYLNLYIEGYFTFQLRNVPMKLTWYTDELFIPGWASQILVEETASGSETYAIPAAYDNLWSINQNANVTIIDEGLSEGIYHKIVYPFVTNTSAKTNKEFVDNLVNQDEVTKLSIVDIATSHYMKKMNEGGQ